MRVENSFIPVSGVGEKTERRLWDAGVTEWERYDGHRPRGVGATTASRIESFVDEALERLADRDATYFHREFPRSKRWRLYETFRDRACFFDIETTGLSERRHEVTTVTFHRGDETTTLVQGQDLTRATIREQFEAADLLVTFNGKRFDVPFLEANFDLHVRTPHLDLMNTCRKLNLSGGLKAIERQLGIDRDGPDIGGREAVRLWHRYESGDEDALQRLVRYNRDDTVNLQRLADITCHHLHHQSPLEDGACRLSPPVTLDGTREDRPS